jgi:hypothetical protein
MSEHKIRQCIDAAQEVNETESGQPADPADNRPTILVTNRYRRDMVNDAQRAIIKKNDTEPSIFVSAGVLARLRFSGANTTREIERFTPDSLNGELDRIANWMKPSRDLDVPAGPPDRVVRDILNLPSYENLPQLHGIAEGPFVDKDAQLIVQPGYHPRAGTYLHWTRRDQIPSVTERPSADELKRATSLIIDELLGDFLLRVRATAPMR